MSSFKPPQRPPPRPDSRRALRIKVPTPLSDPPKVVRHTSFAEIAEEFEDNGRFDEALTRIQGWLREAVKSRNVHDVAYYSAAFRAFLKAKGGSYSLAPPLPHARATPGPPPPVAPAAALDGPSPAGVSSEPVDAMRNVVRLSAVDFATFDD